MRPILASICLLANMDKRRVLCNHLTFAEAMSRNLQFNQAKLVSVFFFKLAGTAR